MTFCHAFIQARMSSSRFRGKVIEPIAGLPSIVYMAKRVAQSNLLNGITVVTSTDSSDDQLIAVLDHYGINSFRGQLDDVLARFCAAAAETDASEFVRLTGDCPLIDPALIDEIIKLRRETGADYASNVDPPSFPDGLDCEVFTRAALEKSLQASQLDCEREHVTLWMRSERSGLSRCNLRGIIDGSALRLTVDYPDDLEVVRALVEALPRDGRYDYYDVLRLLASRKDLYEHNRHIRNEALLALAIDNLD